jgi:hypothetical protein
LATGRREVETPLGSGRVVWTALGSLTVGLGDNRGFGGTFASDFALATQFPGATLTADGTSVIDKGALILSLGDLGAEQLDQIEDNVRRDGAGRHP